MAIGCTQKTSTTDNIHFGEKIDETGAISYAEVISRLENEDEFETKMVGQIQKVCKKKGCWITLNDPDVAGEDIFVRFTDYGFFLPLDCEGRKVVMAGKAFKEATSVEELRHYAEDEGKSAEEIAAIIEPQVEFKFMADGVKMIN